VLLLILTGAVNRSKHVLREVERDSYLEVSGLRADPSGPLFPTTLGKTRKLGTRPMTRIDAARMLKRCLAKGGIVGAYSPHSFRATGLTRFLEEGGTLEGAQNIADHADSRTTKLYDRRQQAVLREDVERIRY
jgi:integrase/recombinase XerD